MSKIKITLTDSNINLLTSFGTVVNLPGRTYVNLPHWFGKNNDESAWEVYGEKDKPDELQDHLDFASGKKDNGALKAVLVAYYSAISDVLESTNDKELSEQCVEKKEAILTLLQPLKKEVEN